VARTFNFDLEKCSYCDMTMRIIAAITNAVSIQKYLDGVGLPSEIPNINMAVIMRSVMNRVHEAA